MSILGTPCLTQVYAGFGFDLSESEYGLQTYPVGLLVLIPSMIASTLYFLRVPRGAFARLKENVRRGVLTQRWLIRAAWSTPLVILVSILFGVASLPVLITIGMLNLLSHVFLIEMDRTNFDLPYVDWAPLFLSMLLFAASIIVIISVGFDSTQLRSLPILTRFVLVGYLLVQLVFYLETVLHYGGYGRWKKLEYSDNAFSLNDITIHLTMLLLFLSFIGNVTS